MEELRDIKGLSTIADLTWLIVVGLVVVIIILSVFVMKWVIHNRKKTKKSYVKKIVIPQNTDSAKACAYALSALKNTMCTEVNKTRYEALIVRLEKYKYKAHEGPLDSEEVMLWNEIFGKKNHDI